MLLVLVVVRVKVFAVLPQMEMYTLVKVFIIQNLIWVIY